MQSVSTNEGSTRTPPATRRWIALVQAGMLVGVYAAEEAEAADRAAMRLTLAGGRHVNVYEIDSSQAPPPPLGTHVDPAQLGWMDVDS